MKSLPSSPSSFFLLPPAGRHPDLTASASSSRAVSLPWMDVYDKEVGMQSLDQSWAQRVAATHAIPNPWQSRNASRLASLTGNQALPSASVPLSKTNMYISVCLCFLPCVRTDSWHAVALARLVWLDGRRETSTNARPAGGGPVRRLLCLCCPRCRPAAGRFGRATRSFNFLIGNFHRPVPLQDVYACILI